MFDRLKRALVVSAALCALPAAATAIAPTIVGAAEFDRRPVVWFTAPSASSVTVTIASKPYRATDGSFFTENIAMTHWMTEFEIATGTWTSNTRLDPGTYWAMVDASPSFDSCYMWDLGYYRYDCADGRSLPVMFTVPRPAVRWTTSSRRYAFFQEVNLTLRASRLGENVPYRVCWLNARKIRKCRVGVVDGYSWDSPASDTIELRTGGMSRWTRFTWTVRGRVVASKLVRTR